MKELMVHIERAVRAVHASPRRKRRMRQELFTHLSALVAEEKARVGDDRQALAEALRRFGAPSDLALDLQASVPRLERWESQLASWFFQRPGQSELQYGVKIAALCSAFVFVGLNLLPLILVAAGAKWSDARVGLAVQSMIALYAFLSALLCHGVFRALTHPMDAASMLRALAYGAGAMLAGVGMIVAGYLTQPENALWEFILRYPGDPRALSAAASFACVPLALALAVAMEARAKRGTRGRWDWSNLEIGE
jgi:hypothetical protein